MAEIPMPVRANGGHLTHFVMVHHSAQSAGGGTEKALCGHAPKNTTGMLRGRWIDDPLDRDREGVAPLSVPSLSRDMCKACVAKLPSWHKLRKQAERERQEQREQAERERAEREQAEREQALALLSEALGEPVCDLVAGVAAVVRQARKPPRTVVADQLSLQQPLADGEAG